MNRTPMDRITQVALPVTAILGNLLISAKHPQYGLPVCLVSEVFWLYSGWISWRKCGQIGAFVTNAIIGGIVAYGVFNYWFIK